MINHPPCWPKGQRCPNACAKAHHDRTVTGSTDLHGHWAGWRIAGNTLVTPDRDRVSSDELAHLIHMARIRAHFENGGLGSQARRARAKREKRLQGAQQTVRVVVVSLSAWKDRHGLSVA